MRLPYNLKVYKMIRPKYGRVVLDEGRTLSGIRQIGFITPFQREKVEFKDGVFEQEADPNMIKPDYNNDVYYGIHSFHNQWECEYASRLYGSTYRWAVIPAGTDIYVGINDIVSSKLLVFETYDDLVKYEEKHGTARGLIMDYKVPESPTTLPEPYIKDATIIDE